MSYFKSQVESLQQPLTIILDALDELSDHGLKLQHWIPEKLPEGVRFIISTSSSDEEVKILPKLKVSSHHKHETLTQCWVDVGPASETTGQHQPNIGPTSRVCSQQTKALNLWWLNVEHLSNIRPTFCVYWGDVG